MFTERSALGVANDHGRTFAADTNIGIGEFFNFTGVLGATTSSVPGEETPTDGREAIILTANYRDSDWQFRSSYDRIGANFNPEVGFLRRSDFQQVSGTIWRNIRVPSSDWIRQFSPHTSYTAAYGLETGFKETATWHIHTMMNLENGGQFGFAGDWIFDGLSEPLDLTTGVDDAGDRTFVEVPTGEYSVGCSLPHSTRALRYPSCGARISCLDSFSPGLAKAGARRCRFSSGVRWPERSLWSTTGSNFRGPEGSSMPPCSAAGLATRSAPPSTFSPSSNTIRRRRFGRETSGSAGSIRRAQVYSSSSMSGRVRGLRASPVAYSSGQSR